MKILIIGAGWYGCHCASVLLDMNIDAKICDLTNEFFTGSSSKNQNRLHLGFHYPRSYSTREECMIGYDLFMKKYSFLTQEIKKNYYCIDQQSIIDFETYKCIYDDFEVVKELDLDLDIDYTQFQGIIKVKERYIDFQKARDYFRNKLGNLLIQNYDENLLNISKLEYDKEQFDYIIDCTYSNINNMFYEDCISLIYESKCNDFAITVMDGPFWSFYPYDPKNNLYTLTDVNYTPFKELDIEFIKTNMLDKILKYIKDFDKCFEYKGYFTSRKSKFINKSDDRSLIWHKKDNIISFSGGKITGIFAMEDIVKKIFQNLTIN